MNYLLIIFLIIFLLNLINCNKEPFIQNLKIYKKCKKFTRTSKVKINHFLKDKIDEIKYKIRRFIRQSKL